MHVTTSLFISIGAYFFGWESLICPLVNTFTPSRNYFALPNTFFQSDKILSARKSACNTERYNFPRYSFSTVGGDASIPFDEDFAESISKPLPKWYTDSDSEREKIIREVERNRERIIGEFKAKYEVTEEQKAKEFQERWSKIEARAKKMNKSNWLAKIKSLVLAKEETLQLTEEEMELAVTTKDKWEKFWEEEEKQTGFRLPGFFEVFPELQLKWPKWAMRKDGTAVECEKDADCPFPQACCSHPIIPGQQFCCTGWGQRIMVPAYARQEIASSPLEDASRANSPGTLDGQSWGCAM